MARKVTFTVDDATIRRLDDAAERTRKPKSEIVREAIAEYHQRIGKLSEGERLRLLSVLAGIRARPAKNKSAVTVEREIAEVRGARKRGGRRGRT